MQLIPFKPAMHIFICVNDRSAKLNNTMPSCAPTITSEMVKEVKEWIRAQGWTSMIYCTKASCLGFCNPDGGVICIWPQGKFFKGLKSVTDIKEVILAEVESADFQ